MYDAVMIGDPESYMDDEERAAKEAQEAILSERKKRATIVLECISNGLSEDDSLTLAEWTPDAFEAYKADNPRYAQLVDRKKVEYKRDLLLPINKAIRDGDEDMAMWMLERKFHDEYSSKKKPSDAPANPIAVIISQIQSGSAGSRVLPRAAKAVVREEIAEQRQATAPEKEASGGKR